jgi:CRP-like cAMP-binding protein
MNDLNAMLQRSFGLTADQAEQCAAAWTWHDHRAGEWLVRQGDRLEDVFFIARGLVRFVYTRTDGREFTKSFLQEGHMGGSMQAYLTDHVAPFGVQALEDSAVGRARHSELEALYARDVAFERMGRVFAQRLAMKKERRERSLLEEDAMTRYLHFLEDHPALPDRVPQYVIATYVGVTEVSLSRLRARLAGR